MNYNKLEVYITLVIVGIMTMMMMSGGPTCKHDIDEDCFVGGVSEGDDKGGVLAQLALH